MKDKSFKQRFAAVLHRSGHQSDGDFAPQNQPQFRKKGSFRYAKAMVISMRQITTTELSCMEVINLCDGGKLGYPSAVELCADDGRVTALIIPRECGLFGLGKSEHYRIPWCRIECLGEDTILVKLTAAEMSSCLVRGSGRKK